jgi:hypothetical protein
MASRTPPTVSAGRALAMAFRPVVVVALLVGFAGAACFKPNIRDGGLICADGGACPDGFRCAADGTCHKGGPVTCDASLVHIDPICTPDPGTDCDPICQSRCDCGSCSLKGGTLACTAPGTKMRGEICTVANDDCAPGNTCMSECGGRVARCFRLCGKGAVLHNDLCAGQQCDTPVDGDPTEHWVCQPPLEACNPVSDVNDCGHIALGCYVSPRGAAVCDCRGIGQLGTSCSNYNSCIPGYRCLAVGGPTSPANCYKTCRLTGSDCTSPATCQPVAGVDYGYCSG